MATAKWGIIGLIGWAYLVSAFVWLACRNCQIAIMGAFALLIALNIGLRSDVLAWWNCIVCATNGWVPSLHLGAYASMVVAGVVVAMLSRSDSIEMTPSCRIVWTSVFGMGFAIAGLLLQPFWEFIRSAVVHHGYSTPWR